MKMPIMPKSFRMSMLLVLIILSFTVFLFFGLSSAANQHDTNYKNVTVRTNVNITNSKPEVLGISISPDINFSQKNITLNAGSLRVVVCNVSLRDWNGYTDIYLVNATLWDVKNSQQNTVDDNNTHYTNYNCTNAEDGVNYTVDYYCNFSVYYYANNGTWNCSVMVTDTAQTSGLKGNTTYFYSIYALNVTDGIFYGNAAVEDYTINTTANVTNFGNMPINITVEGYGSKQGDGLAMNCSLGGNITVDNERFSLYDTAFSSRTVLNSSPVNVNGLTVLKQTVPNTLMTNSTYWQMFINSTNNPGGNCSGYVIFTAMAS